MTFLEEIRRHWIHLFLISALAVLTGAAVNHYEEIYEHSTELAEYMHVDSNRVMLLARTGTPQTLYLKPNPKDPNGPARWYREDDSALGSNLKHDTDLNKRYNFYEPKKGSQDTFHGKYKNIRPAYRVTNRGRPSERTHMTSQSITDLPLGRYEYTGSTVTAAVSEHSLDPRPVGKDTFMIANLLTYGGFALLGIWTVLVTVRLFRPITAPNEKETSGHPETLQHPMED